MVRACAPRRDARRGAALFVVLLFSALLAALAAAAMRTGLSGSRAAAVFADTLRADELGRGAGDMLAYHLARGDAAAKRGGRIALRLPGAAVVVDYRSESARVDANAAPVALIASLLGAAGGDPDEIATVSARIEALRAAASRRATSAASTGGLAALTASLDAMGPARAPAPAAVPTIRDVAEIPGAWGLPAALARRVLPALTVANGTAKVDPVLADRLVVAALLGSDERVDDYLERRQRGFVNAESALDLLPVPMRGFVGFKDVAAVRAIARVTVARRLERRYELVLAPGPARGAGPDRDTVPVVVSWRKLL